MKKVLTQREKVILYATGGIIIFSVLFNILVVPVLNKNDALNKEIIITRTRLTKYLQLLSQKDYIQGKASQLPQALKESGAKQDAFVAALSVLENLAREAGIRITDMRPQAGYKATGAHKEIIIDLRAEGTLESYLKFLYSLENSLSLLNIKKMQLSARRNTEALEGVFTISQISLGE